MKEVFATVRDRRLVFLGAYVSAWQARPGRVVHALYTGNRNTVSRMTRAQIARVTGRYSLSNVGQDQVPRLRTLLESLHVYLPPGVAITIGTRFAALHTQQADQWMMRARIDLRRELYSPTGKLRLILKTG